MRTYGSCTYNKRNQCWDLVVEPHVAIRLKRVFAKIDTWQYGKQSISATPENCRDLQWFLDRYPLEVYPFELMTERAQQHRERQSIIEQLLNGYMEREAFKMKLPPREYQAMAAHMWLTAGGLLLADDVGLGKTATALAGFTDPRTLPALVVTLTHLPFQWRDEVNKFTDLTTHIFKKGTPYDILKYTKGKLPDVFITNYSKLSGWAETIAPIVHSVVFDEIQELRHTGTQKYNAAKHIADACDFRLGTSATPIYNYGGEIFNIIDVLLPDSLGTSEEFIREWCIYQYGDKVKIKDPSAFGLFARENGLMLRRTRKEVKRELPPVTVVPHHIDANPAVIDKLKGQAIELAKLILKQTQDFKGQKMQAAGEFDMKMRQATGIAKAPYVAEFVKFLIQESDEPVVLYGWHREVYSIWMEQLKEFNPVMYTGSESPTQKEASKQALISGKSKVLIISLRAGAGMDGLQDVCHIAVFGELDWSPGVHEQCLSNDTEILTKRGFVGRLNISEDDEVAAFDTDTEQIVWCTIDSITDRELSLSEVMYSVQQPGMDLRLTGGHRMVYRHAWGKGKSKLTPWKIQTAEELSQRGQSYHLPVAGIQMAEGVPLSDDELRFLGWFVTDGNRNDASGSVTICQNENSPYTQNILDCLKACGFHYTTNLITKDSQWERSSPLVRYCIPKYGDKKPGYLDSNTGWNRLDIYLDKNLSPSLEHMDTRQLGIFLEAVHMGDGNKQLGKNWIQRTYHITSGNSTFIERLQSLCIRRGWRANLFTRNDEDGSVSFVLHTKPIAYRSICGTASKGRPTLSPSTSQPGERVWCITNRLGTLIVRRNGKTAIVGNCIGRIHRDGQDEPVMVYYLLSEHGSDPVMSDLLGIKRQQIEGVRDPNQDLVTKLQVEADYIKRMAEKFLTDHGIELPKEETIEPLI